MARTKVQNGRRQVARKSTAGTPKNSDVKSGVRKSTDLLQKHLETKRQLGNAARSPGRKGKTLQKATKSTTQGSTTKRKNRYRPGMLALKDIKRLQGTTDLLIPRARFQRLVREITQDYKTGEIFKFQSAALLALQEACESYLVRLFEDTNLCCIHARRVTIMPRDIHLARRIRNERN